MSVSFGLRIPLCASPTEVAGCVREAEDAGFDVAWLPDSQFLWRDVWATAAVAAMTTGRIQLGSCVTNFETRHVSVTASAVATLCDLAPGRVILGVGSGDSSVKTLGLEPTRLVRMREQVSVVRQLLAGEEVEFAGRPMRIRHAPGTVPVYLAANGPKALELAGEIADGVITVSGLRPDLVEHLRARIATGAARGGRAMDAVELCVGTFCHITNDEDEAARIVKPYVVAMAQVGGGETLRSIGIDIDPPPVVDGIYPDLSHAEDWDAAADAASRWVTDEMALRYAEAFCLVGSAETCVERLSRAVAAGATSFYIRHVSSYTLPSELVRAFGDSVLPRVR